jgi:glycerophosphoryl diester phosphodiesterase
MLQGMMLKQIPALVALLVLASCNALPGANGASGAWPYPTLSGGKPLLIAHRGASGVLPEHTLEAYQRAIDDGTDCIEPDLVLTKDGVLVDRHDTWLSTTTNVASHPEFANRKRKGADAEAQGREDWWVADFTLAELKTLRTIQPFRGRSKAFDGLYPVATFDEVLDLALRNHTTKGGPVCVYPEAKSPAYHASLGFTDMAEKILAALKAKGLDKKGSPIFIQCFEPDFVKKIQPMTELPVIFLVGDNDGLEAAYKMPGAPFWDGLGASTNLLHNADGSPSNVIRDSHAKKIPVHSWTYRDDAPPYGGTVEEALKKDLAQGLDGFFTDFPATGRRVINEISSGAAAAQ